MNNSNSFYSKMEALTDDDLLKVIGMKEEYQPEAYSAAQEVLKNRNLSSELINEINSKIESTNFQLKEKKEKQTRQVNDALKMTSIFTLGVSTEFDDKQIKGFKFFIIGLIIYYLFFIYTNFSFAWYYINNEGIVFDQFTFEILLYDIVYPIGIYLFAKLRNEGWKILLYLFVSKLIFFVFITGFYFISEFNTMFEDKEPSLLDDLVQEPNHMISLIIILALGSIVWFLLKASILKLFKIDDKAKKINIIAAVVVALVYVAFFFVGIGL